MLVGFFVVDVFCDFELNGIVRFVERGIAGSSDEDLDGRCAQPAWRGRA